MRPRSFVGAFQILSCMCAFTEWLKSKVQSRDFDLNFVERGVVCFPMAQRMFSIRTGEPEAHEVCDQNPVGFSLPFI